MDGCRTYPRFVCSAVVPLIAVAALCWFAAPAQAASVKLENKIYTSKFFGKVNASAKCRKGRTVRLMNTPNFGRKAGKTIQLARTKTGRLGRFTIKLRRMPNGGPAWVVVAKRGSCTALKSNSLYFGP